MLVCPCWWQFRSFLSPRTLNLTVASFFVFFFKDKRVFFGLFDRRWSQILTRSPKTPLKFDGGSFEPIKKFRKFFFIGSLTGSESENHRYDQSAEVIWIKATSSYYLCLPGMSGSLKNVGSSFKRRKRTHLVK